jgi:UDP-glucose 4-epimerase
LIEESEKECKTVYALNKLCCESLLDIFASHYSLRYACFRICVPYGNVADVVYSYGTLGFLLRQASQGEIVLYGNGLQRRTFTHVGDIAAIMHEAAVSRKLQNDVYNIGGEDFSLRSVAELIALRKRCPIRSVPWPEDDLSLESGDTVFDHGKLQRDLGYVYRHRLEQWIDKLL